MSATPDAREADVIVALGANVGDRLGALRAAVAALDATDGVRVVAASGVYETEAHVRPGALPQRDHLNAVVLLSVTLAPLDLLTRLHAIERAAGRDPGADSWSPRELDLDVLLWDDDVLELAGLSVPHPRMAERRFVLAPLADVAANRVVPVDGRCVAELLASTPDASRVARVASSEALLSRNPSSS